MNETRKIVLAAIESCISRDYMGVHGYAPRERLALAFLSGYLERDEPEISRALERLRIASSAGFPPPTI